MATAVEYSFLRRPTHRCWQNTTAKFRAETKILDPARDREEGNRVCPLKPVPGGRQAAAVERVNAREALADALHFNEGLGHEGVSCGSR
jgi:hypothetical protein